MSGTIKLTIWLCLLFFAKHLHAEPCTLTLAVNSPGTPPHLFYNEELGIYDGVIPDLLRFAEEEGSFKIVYVDSHRSRNEYFVAAGRFDMFYSSVDWVKEPEKLISTIPIFKHSSHLYSLEPFPDDFELNAETKSRVCARRGFSYPGLDEWFENGKLIRIDSTSHHTMLDMLELGRCDMAELNRKNMLAMLKVEKFKHLTFYQHKKPTSEVPASLIMNPARVEERDLLNKYIKAFLDAGRYEPSLKKHLEKL